MKFEMIGKVFRAALIGTALFAASAAQAVESPDDWGPWGQAGYVPGALGDEVAAAAELAESGIPSDLLLDPALPALELGPEDAQLFDPIDTLAGIVLDTCSELGGGVCDLTLGTLDTVSDAVEQAVESTGGSVEDLVGDVGDTVEDVACVLLAC